MNKQEYKTALDAAIEQIKKLEQLQAGFISVCTSETKKKWELTEQVKDLQKQLDEAKNYYAIYRQKYDVACYKINKQSAIIEEQYNVCSKVVENIVEYYLALNK